MDPVTDRVGDVLAGRDTVSRRIHPEDGQLVLTQPEIDKNSISGKPNGLIPSGNDARHEPAGTLIDRQRVVAVGTRTDPESR